MPGDPYGYPSEDEIADYLERYARHFEVPVILKTGIRSLSRLDGGLPARTDAGEIIDARAVVLATGAFQRPAIPATSSRISPDGHWSFTMAFTIDGEPWELARPHVLSKHCCVTEVGSYLPR